MGYLRWYEAEVLMVDLTGHRHAMRGACAGEIEARMSRLYPKALTVLVRPEVNEVPPPDGGAVTDPDYLLVASFPTEPPLGRP